MKEISVDVEKTFEAKPRVSKVRKMNDQALIQVPAKPGDYYTCTSSKDGNQIVLTRVETRQEVRDALLDSYLKIVMESNPEMSVEEARGFVIATLEKQIAQRRQL